MSDFVSDGQIDRSAFESAIGGLIRAHVEAGNRVQVYGEMVALLWGDGHVLAAIELESLWNDLGRSMSFSLRCAYEAGLVSGHAHADAIERVRRRHSSVLDESICCHREDRVMPGAEVFAQFPADIRAPRAARHFVVNTMRQWGFSPDLLDDAALVTTELAANAVVHAESAFSVALRVEDAVVRIAIEDGEPIKEENLIVRPGRGLGLVAGLALRWGAENSAHSKVVWAELDGIDHAQS